MNLPHEILEKILDYLPIKDLKELTTCCHDLNNFVSESMLMRKLTLNLKGSQLDENHIFIPNRKYRKIKIIGNADDVIVKLNAERIEHACLIESFITKNLVEFLEKCSQLESIEFEKPQYPLIDIQRPFELMKLKSLKLKDCQFPINFVVSRSN